MKRLTVAAFITLTLLVADTAPAEANSGIRFGLTDDPDTITFGFFYEHLASRLGRKSFLSLEPGIDVGFASDPDLFTVRGTFNFKFLFLTGRAQLYPLVGVSVYYRNHEHYDHHDHDHTDFGVNLGGGVQFDRFSFELWVGIQDLPDITFLFGLSF